MCRLLCAKTLRSGTPSGKVPALPRNPLRSTRLNIAERTSGEATIIDITGDIDLASFRLI